VPKRNFVVTGATKGIGRAISERLTEAGHHVIGIARSDDASFQGSLVRMDLSDTKASAEAFADLAQRYDVDGVVNNAGFVKLHHVGDINLDDADEIWRGNIHPAIVATQALLPGMKDRGWGRVVNISSLTVLGVAKRSAYAASKAALNSLTRTWALELAETGVTINGVAPGPIETELFRKNTPVGSEAEQWFLRLIPMNRLGQPKEIAAATTFFLSEDAGYVTGQVLFVDGGGSVGRRLD